MSIIHLSNNKTQLKTEIMKFSKWIQKLDQWPDKEMADLFGRDHHVIKPNAQFTRRSLRRKFATVCWRFVLEPKIKTVGKNGWEIEISEISDNSGKLIMTEGKLEWIPKSTEH